MPTPNFALLKCSLKFCVNLWYHLIAPLNLWQCKNDCLIKKLNSRFFFGIATSIHTPLFVCL